MFKLARMLQRRLVYVIPLVMIAGFITGLQIDARPLKQLIVPLTFLMVYPMMVNLQIRKVVEGGDVKVQVVTQLLNFLVIPLIAYGMARVVFPDSPYLALGLLLSSLLPTSGMTISWTGMARGNMPAAVKMTVFGLLIGSVLTPVYIKALMGTVIEIPMTQIVKQIVLIVMLPMILGHITQQLLVRRYGMARYQKDIKQLFPPISTLGVLGVVFAALALKAQSIAANPFQLVRLLIPVVALYATNFFISTIVGRLFFKRGDAIALVYGTVMRNLSIALAIAMTAFREHGSEISLIIAMSYIIQVQSAAWYVRFTDKLFGKAPEPSGKDVMLEGVFALHDRNTLGDAIKLLSEEEIGSIAVLDDSNKPIGMLSTSTIIDALADEVPHEASLASISLEPVLISSASTPLQTVLKNMKRTHEYKALIVDSKGSLTHVIPQEQVLSFLAEEMTK